MSAGFYFFLILWTLAVLGFFLLKGSIQRSRSRKGDSSDFPPGAFGDGWTSVSHHGQHGGQAHHDAGAHHGGGHDAGGHDGGSFDGGSSSHH